MGENSKIGWTDHTMNFWWGCHKVSEECRHCYISGIMKRGGYEPFQGPLRTSASLWKNPAKWDRRAAESGTRPRVFTCSMSDFFHPGSDAWRAEAWDIIRACRNLDWLILTKRPELIRDRLPADWGQGYANVWLGVTVGCDSSMPRVAHLMEIPAAVRFVSCEPLLGTLPVSQWGIDWVITGCEQAALGQRREMDLDWVRDIDRQCQQAGVPHFFKQHYVNGKLVTDGLLDGRLTQNYPQTGAAHVV